MRSNWGGGMPRRCLSWVTHRCLSPSPLSALCAGPLPASLLPPSWLSAPACLPPAVLSVRPTPLAWRVTGDSPGVAPVLSLLCSWLGRTSDGPGNAGWGCAGAGLPAPDQGALGGFRVQPHTLRARPTTPAAQVVLVLGTRPGDTRPSVGGALGGKLLIRGVLTFKHGVPPHAAAGVPAQLALNVSLCPGPDLVTGGLSQGTFVLPGEGWASLGPESAAEGRAFVDQPQETSPKGR